MFEINDDVSHCALTVVVFSLHERSIKSFTVFEQLTNMTVHDLGP